MSEIDQKIARLPTWARDHIRRLEIRSEPAIEEAARARKALEAAQKTAIHYREANAALMELLGKAGTAGLDWAATVVSVLEGYEIFRSPELAEVCPKTGELAGVPEQWTAEDILRNEG